ncbi:MAG: glycoside hydrolase family 5 protein [Oscillospiraceae bacterium]|jgi:endoglucanase|nr:glycoside hydrolase family 5 protein [Oscillospiraceae bacterium]
MSKRIISLVLAAVLMLSCASCGLFGEDGISPLSVDGTHIKDQSGNIVQLRGISTHGLSWFPEFVNEEAIATVKSEFSANTLRLAMYTADGGYCTGGSANQETLRQLIYKGVDIAVANDMYVIIDWHILNDNDPNKYKAEAVEFFSGMAEKYKDTPNVIFEICNEPNGNVTWADIKSYAEEVIAAIRENGSNAVVIVGTPSWSQEVDAAAANPIESDDNVVYALHFYASTHKQWLRDRAKAAIDSGLPLFVSEFAICEASGDGVLDKSEGRQWLEFLDENNVGYIAWNLSNKAEASALIKPTAGEEGKFGAADLSEWGEWLSSKMTARAAAETAK